jgi:hypothetical protein
VIPWIILAVIAVPLVVIAFARVRRTTVAGERAVVDTEEARTRTEREFAEAEAYEEEWHEQDKERYHGERLP